MEDTGRAQHEIEHGEWLAERDPERIWGWDTPAGRIRARRRAALIAEGGGLGPNVTALEIGCGTGLFSSLFAETGAHIVAVDISGALLERARERAIAPNRVRFVERRFEDCDIDGPFDAVIGSSILHHLDMKGALPRIRELLKPGGRMSFAEPNLLNPQVLAERTFRSWFPYTSPDETAFVRSRLRATMVASGFVDVEIAPFDWLHPATPPRWIPAVRRLGAWLEKLPGLREFSGSLLISGRRPATSCGASPRS